jgi:arylsulfatase A-like enzyme
MTTTPRNLLLVSLDTLRADVAYGGALRHLTALAASGSAFLNTVSSAPLTPVSHASIFTALQPHEHGLRHLLRERMTSPKPTLAELLALAGYDTGAVLACPGLNRWYGMHRGFAHYDDEVPRLADGRDPLKVGDVKIRGTALKRAPLVVERALAWLEPRRRARSPFFLFAHFFDTHWPYEAPERFGPAHANPYEQEAHYVDHYLAQLVERMREWGLLENTLVVVFSDHGEDLAGWYPNDHGGPELGHPEENGHGCLLHDATQMVPLVFIGDGIPIGIRIREQVRLVDIMPSILELLNVPDNTARAGESLVPYFSGDHRHRVAYSETYYPEEQPAFPGLGPLHAVRLENRFKVIVDVRTGVMTAYDLIGDPHELAGIPLGPVPARATTTAGVTATVAAAAAAALA